MSVEWDPAKAKANWVKHGVMFSDAVTVLDDPNALTMKDERSPEERWVAIGADDIGRILVVVFTWRGEALRLISARRATSRERSQYLEGI